MPTTPQTKTSQKIRQQYAKIASAKPIKKPRRKSSRAHSPALLAATQQRLSAAQNAAPVFTPHLLEVELKPRSGYLFFLGEYVSIANQWLACLKQHPNYTPIHIEENADVHTILQTLHSYTDKLFEGYNWFLSDEHRYQEGTVTIYYHQAIDCYENNNLPIDWLYKHKNSNVSWCGLWLIKAIAQKFNIGYISNHCFETIFDCIFNEETMISELKERFDNGSEQLTMLEVYRAAADILEYQAGDADECKVRLSHQDISDEAQFIYLQHKLKDSEPQLYAWFEQGLNLLKEESFNLENFMFDPDNSDEPMIGINSYIFFPYSFNGFVWEYYEEFLTDQAQNIGELQPRKFGTLTAEKHIAPETDTSLDKLLSFMRAGFKLYKEYAA